MDKTIVDTIQEPITSARAPVRQIIERVLELEKERHYQRNYKNINDEILKIIKYAIDETNINSSL